MPPKRAAAAAAGTAREPPVSSPADTAWKHVPAKRDPNLRAEIDTAVQATLETVTGDLDERFTTLMNASMTRWTMLQGLHLRSSRTSKTLPIALS